MDIILTRSLTFPADACITGSISNASIFLKKTLRELPLIIAMLASRLALARLNVSWDGRSLLYTSTDMWSLILVSMHHSTGSYDAPNTFDDLPSIPLEAPQSSPALPSRPLSPPASFNEQQPQADSSSTIPQIPLPLPPMPHPLTPSDSGDEPDNGDDGDYFATVQGAERSNNTKGKGRLSDDNEADDHDHDHEEEDDDEEAEAEDTYDERGISIKRKKKAGTAASTAASRKGHQRRKSSSAGTSSAAKRRRRVVEDEEEAAERRSKASASTDKVCSVCQSPKKGLQIVHPI